MKRRNVLSALGAVATGGTLVTATGAFSSVSANRQVSVEAVGDNSALLRMTPVVHRIEGSDPATVRQTDDGLLEIDVTQGGASGVNVDAVTWIGTPDYEQQSAWVDVGDDNIDWINSHTYTPRAAFGVENRGTQDYELTFGYEYTGDPGDSELTFHIYDGAAPTFGADSPSIYGQVTAGNSVTVPDGDEQESFKLGKRIFASVEVDTTDGSTENDLSGTLTIAAETS